MKAPKRLVHAFNARIGRIGLALTLGTTLLVAVVTARVLHAQAREAIRQQALICVAAIDPSEGGDIYPSFQRLRSRYPELVAVATLDSLGNVQSLMPDIRPYRDLATMAAHQSDTPVRYSAGTTLGGGVLWGVSTPLAPADDSNPRRLVVMLSESSTAVLWWPATIVFGVCVMAGMGLSMRAMRRWFHEQVLLPLRNISDSVIVDPGRRHRAPSLNTRGWQEFEVIVDRVHGLRKELVESDGRRRRVEHLAERRIEEEQVGSQRKLRRAHHRAMIDPLTGLYNRAFIEERLETIFQEQRSSGGDLALAMIDLDNFKPHNDTHGHAAGDDVLRFLGRLLAGAIRPTDFAVRYGGDEFLLILTGADTSQARAVAQRIATLFGQYATNVGSQQGLAVSVGVASLSETSCANGHALVACADRALYGVKRAGKNGVGVHNSSTSAVPFPAAV